MKYIKLNPDSSVEGCYSFNIADSIAITDEQAKVFKYTTRHDLVKYINGQLVENTELIAQIQLAASLELSATEQIWKALDDAKLGVVIPPKIKEKLDKVK